MFGPQVTLDFNTRDYSGGAGVVAGCVGGGGPQPPTPAGGFFAPPFCIVFVFASARMRGFSPPPVRAMATARPPVCPPVGGPAGGSRAAAAASSGGGLCRGVRGRGSWDRGVGAAGGFGVFSAAWEPRVGVAADPVRIPWGTLHCKADLGDGPRLACSGTGVH